MAEKKNESRPPSGRRNRLFRVLFFGFVLLRKFCGANFNLYLSQEEVKRILGLDAELFYVREGVINEYATGWSVKVPPDIHSLFFRWEALVKKPILYNLAVGTADSAASSPSPLMAPSVNISLSGILPKTPTTFRLDLICTGKVSAEVEVILSLNVTSSRPDLPPTVLLLKRRKICLEGTPNATPGDSSHRQRLDGDSEGKVFFVGDGLGEVESSRFPLSLYFICGVTSLVFVVCAVVGVVMHRRRNARRNQTTVNTSTSSSSTKDSRTLLEKPEVKPRGKRSASSPDTTDLTLPTSISINSYASLHLPPADSNYYLPQSSGIYESSYCWCDDHSSSSNCFPEEGPNSPPGTSCLCSSERELLRPLSTSTSGRTTAAENLRRLQMEPQRVRVTEVLQEGTRGGRLCKGFLQREHPELDQQVFVKTVHASAEVKDEWSLSSSALCREGLKLSSLRHPNVLTLVGLCLMGAAPPLLVYPDPSGCNLKLFLESNSGFMKVEEFVDASIQLTKAVAFLHANSVTHEDIAARNCVMSGNLRLRLSDSVLARDFFPGDYELWTKKQKTPMPIRWMPPELLLVDGDLNAHHFSFASDIWSLGVTLWELCGRRSGVGRPYEDTAAEDLLQNLLEGRRPQQAPTCPDQLYHLMTMCWSVQSNKRPSARSLSGLLLSFSKTLQDFV